MIMLWASRISNIHTAAIPMIVSGRADNVLVTKDAILRYNIKRLRILMALLSFSAAAFCLAVPLMVTANSEPTLFYMVAIEAIILITIIKRSKTWAKL